MCQHGKGTKQKRMLLKLREIRLIRKRTQEEVSDAVGCSVSAYSRYESGAREPSLDMLAALADYFDVSADYLLGRKPVESSGLSEYEIELISAVRKVPDYVREDALEFMNMKNIYKESDT